MGRASNAMGCRPVIGRAAPEFRLRFCAAAAEYRDVLPEPASAPMDPCAELVERAASLPVANAAVLLHLAQLCESPMASASGIALEAARDEGFSALLLRLANSAYYIGTSRVADLSTAVARLGLRTVASLAVATPGLR